MSKYIKLLGPVFHNDIEYDTNSILSVPDDITESESDRLIKLGAAVHEAVTIVTKTTPVEGQLIDGLTKKQCQTELTAAGIVFDKKSNLAELQKLVLKLREAIENNTPADIGALPRGELESELTARAIEFTAEQTDDELRQLLIDDESDDDDLDINSLSREQLELELTARAIEFTAEQSDDELRQLLIDDESDNDD